VYPLNKCTRHCTSYKSEGVLWYYDQQLCFEYLYRRPVIGFTAAWRWRASRRLNRIPIGASNSPKSRRWPIRTLDSYPIYRLLQSSAITAIIEWIQYVNIIPILCTCDDRSNTTTVIQWYIDPNWWLVVLCTITISTNIESIKITYLYFISHDSV